MRPVTKYLVYFCHSSSLQLRGRCPSRHYYLLGPKKGASFFEGVPRPVTTTYSVRRRQFDATKATSTRIIKKYKKRAHGTSIRKRVLNASISVFAYLKCGSKMDHSMHFASQRTLLHREARICVAAFHFLEITFKHAVQDAY
jgi:hypothetical protein